MQNWKSLLNKMPIPYNLLKDKDKKDFKTKMKEKYDITSNK